MLIEPAHPPRSSYHSSQEGAGRAADGRAGAGRKKQQQQQQGGRGLWPSNIQDSEQQLRGLALRLDDDEDDDDDEGRRRAQERHNSAGLSPVTRPPLPTAGRSGAHRHLGSNSGVDAWHEHNELPASAEDTAIGAGFNVYEAAAARGRWEAMALGYADGSSSSSSNSKAAGGAKKAKASGSSQGQGRRHQHHQQQQYQQEKVSTVF